MFKKLIFCLFLIIPLFFYAQENNIRKLDSIFNLRVLSKNLEFDAETRLKYAKQAYNLSKALKIDTTILKSGRNLASIYLNEEDYENYQEANYKNFGIAKKLRDSSAIAFTNFNLGWYHYIFAQNDSAYYYFYNARKMFSALKDPVNESSVLSNMANIQESENDYIGGELNAIQAIEIVSSLPETNSNLETLWSLNNILAVISERLERRTEAIKYYEKTIEISKKMENSRYYYLNSINNLGYTIEQQGDLNGAMSLYREVVNDKDLFEVDPQLYIVAKSNIARIEFMLDESNVTNSISALKEALKVTDSVDDTINEMAIYGYLADIHFKSNSNDSALYYSRKAYDLAKMTNSNVELLDALKLMSKLDTNENSFKYLNEHIRIKDSLFQKERAIRNKFARIEFETDQIKAENEQISKERLMFLVSSVGLLVTLILLYVIISQRAKNKELKFSKAQQEANEEIYNLMLAQQDKVDEGRTQEKKRISEELHDGILGRLFGTRLSLDSLNFVNTDEAIKTRGQYIGELKSIEEEIRKISHDLNTDFVSGSSFSDIIQAYIETQTQAYQLAYEYYEDDDIDWDELSNKTKIHVYRMLQETMQNIYKHANAKHIKISFRLKNNVILLTIEDDGSGFNTNKARKGIGLKNFDSRAGEIGGKVEIFSNPGEGTKVIIHVPTE